MFHATDNSQANSSSSKSPLLKLMEGKELIIKEILRQLRTTPFIQTESNL